jgi:molybdopterin-guanine dinucleotide biosynthesis protein A
MLIPSITGLVLAGGRSERMGRDKALLVMNRETQLARAARVLAEICGGVLVAVRAEQAETSAYPSFDLVADESGVGGPAAGLLGAWRRVPEDALLVLAVDMPQVDAPLLRRLIESRNAGSVATAFVHADGTLEPLCTIWEPAAQAILRERARNSNVSLRSVLESSTVCRVVPPVPASIRSVNTPQDYAALRRRNEV